jgi:hypothetical protein
MSMLKEFPFLFCNSINNRIAQPSAPPDRYFAGAP